MSDQGNNPWIEWRGGWTPLKPGTHFEALHRDGHVTRNRVAYASDRWEHLGTGCDIVAYRVTAAHQPAKEPK